MLKYSVDNLDGLGEGVAQLYEAVPEGGFKLQVEGIPTVADKPAETPEKLLGALQSERKITSRLESELKAWKKLGATPDEVVSSMTKPKKAEGDADEAQKMLAQAQEQYATELQKITEERDAALTAERLAVVESGFTSALARAGFTDTGIEMIPQLHSKRVRMVERDGGRYPEIMTAEGTVPMVGTGENLRATFDDLAKELSKQYPDLVHSDRKGGSATLPGSGRANSEQVTMLRNEWQALPNDKQGEVIRSGVKLVD